jgi:serine/threonine protein phosphatase PrpC
MTADTGDVEPETVRLRERDTVTLPLPTKGVQLTAAGGTDIGLVRRNNEDSFAVVPGRGLFMVADGVGGQPGGEVASSMAVDIVRSCLEEDGCDDDEWPCTGPGTLDGDEARFIHAVRRANRRIYERGRTEMPVRRMATTFAGVLVSAGGVHIAHVGDSRVYRLRGGELTHLTQDHTLLEELRRQGALYLENDLDPHLARRITRAVGADRDVEVETRVEQARPGDVLLVCSDGLWGPVPEDEIADMLSWKVAPQAIVRELITRTLRHGAPDNVTCVVVRLAAD